MALNAGSQNRCIVEEPITGPVDDLSGFVICESCVESWPGLKLGIEHRQEDGALEGPGWEEALMADVWIMQQVDIARGKLP